MASALDKLKLLLTSPEERKKLAYKVSPLSMVPTVLGRDSSARKMIGENASNFLVGSSRVNPFLGGMGIGRTVNKTDYDALLPQNNKERNTQDLGEFLTALFTFKTPAKAIPRMVGASGALSTAGTLFNTLPQGRLPTKEEWGETTRQAVRNAPYFRPTSIATNAAIGNLAKVRGLSPLAKYTDEALTTSIGKTAPKGIQSLFTKQAAGNIGKSAVREMAETPAETAALALMAKSRGETDSALQYAKDDFIPNLVGNAAFGGAMGTGKTALKAFKPGIDAAKSKVTEVNQRLGNIAPVGATTKEVDMKTRISTFDKLYKEKTGRNLNSVDKQNIERIVSMGGGGKEIGEYLSTKPTPPDKQTVTAFKKTLSELLPKYHQATNKDINALVKEFENGLPEDKVFELASQLPKLPQATPTQLQVLQRLQSAAKELELQGRFKADPEIDALINNKGVSQEYVQQKTNELFEQIAKAKESPLPETDAFGRQNKPQSTVGSPDELLKLARNNGGSRTVEDVAKLKADIAKNGIKEPIVIVKDESGQFIGDGVHRLQIAKELGIKDVPYVIRNKSQSTVGGVKLYHGGKPLNTFKDGDTIWFSTNKTVAGVNAADPAKWHKRLLNGANIDDLAKEFGIEQAKPNLKNPFVIDAKGAFYSNIPTPKEMKGYVIDSMETVDTDLIVDWAKQNGHDGVVIKNVLEGKGADNIADTVAVFSPKSVISSNASQSTVGGKPQVEEDMNKKQVMESLGGDDIPLPRDPNAKKFDAMDFSTYDERSEIGRRMAANPPPPDKPPLPKPEPKPVVNPDELTKRAIAKDQVKQTKWFEDIVSGKSDGNNYEKQIRTADNTAIMTRVRTELETLKLKVEAKGYTQEQFIDFVESQKVPKELEPEFKILKRLTDFQAKLGQIRTRKKPSQLEGYFPRRSLEQIETYKEKSLGHRALEQSYLLPRTGKLQSYVKDFRAVEMLYQEALGSNDPKVQRIERVIDQLNDEAAVRRSLDTVVKGTLRTAPDFVGRIHQATPQKRTVQYRTKDKNEIARGLDVLFRSNNDRATAYGQKFWDSFIDPFQQAKIKTDNEAVKIQEQMKDQPQEAVARAILRQYYENTSMAADTFIKNTIEADLDETGKKLVNSIYDEYVLSGNTSKKTFEKILGGLRGSVGRGAIGFNLSSAIMNVLETKRIAALISTKALGTASKRAASGENLLIKYGKNDLNNTAVERVDLTKPEALKKRGLLMKTLQKADPMLFYLFDKSERFKDNLMLLGLEEQGMDKGLRGKDLERFVLQKFDQYAIKYGKGNDIGLYRSPLAKTIFQFGQYPIKDLVIGLDKAGGAFKNVGDRKYLAKYAVMSGLQMGAFQLLINRKGFGDQTNTFLDPIIEMTSRGIPLSPAVSLTISLFDELASRLKDEEEDYLEKAQRQGNIKRAATTVAIPGSNQLYWKTGRYGIDLSKAEMKTNDSGLNFLNSLFGEKTQNVANPTSTDPFSVAKGFAFGRSYDPKRQEYIKGIMKDESPSLTKAQSAIYRDKVKNEGREPAIEYYDTKKVQDQRIKQNKDQVAKTKEDGFLKRLFNKQEELPATTLPKNKEEEKEFNSMMQEYINSGNLPDDASLKHYYFKDYSPNKPEERGKIVASLDKVLGDELLSEDIKAKAMELSGIPEKDLAYYMVAKGSHIEKQQLFTQLADQLPRNEFMNKLAESRRYYGGKVLLSTDVIDYLYDKDILSKDEKTALSAIKYDETTDEFYIDRDKRSGGSGSGSSGSSGSSGRYSSSEIASLLKKIYSIYEIPAPPPFKVARKTTSTGKMKVDAEKSIREKGKKILSDLAS